MNARTTKRRSRVVSILGVVIFVLILAAILIPHNMVSRMAHDEASAMESLHALKDLELRYAVAHPSKGFTCDFALLKTEARSSGEQIQEGFLFSEGYKFSLTGCEADSEGVAVRYKATAIPVLPGKTGFRAFCTDQTGELRYAANGSPESCQPL
jgi:type IV pilus assembly protein PilA